MSHPIMTNFLPYPFTFVALRRYSSGVHLETNSVYIFDNLHSIKLSTDHRPFLATYCFFIFFLILQNLNSCKRYVPTLEQILTKRKAYILRPKGSRIDFQVSLGMQLVSHGFCNTTVRWVVKFLTQRYEISLILQKKLTYQKHTFEN